MAIRSPNYPNYDLDGALILTDKVFSKDGRAKVSRATLANHLGHESLSGPALGKIGALRAYGLLEGSGDEMRVSEDAISALKAPSGSAARQLALSRLALQPPLFQLIKAEFPTVPSHANLTYWLIKQGFSETAAGIAAKSYLKTMAVVGEFGAEYAPEAAGGGDVSSKQTATVPPSRAQQTQQVKIMDGERIVFTEEGSPNQYLKLLASGEVDDFLLEALEDFVKRQRKRLKAASGSELAKPN
jgi:hypothetical protein